MNMVVHVSPIMQVVLMQMNICCSWSDAQELSVRTQSMEVVVANTREMFQTTRKASRQRSGGGYGSNGGNGLRGAGVPGSIGLAQKL